MGLIEGLIENQLMRRPIKRTDFGEAKQLANGLLQMAPQANAGSNQRFGWGTVLSYVTLGEETSRKTDLSKDSN